MFTGGLDIGTSGCKIAIYDENAVLKKIAYREYDVKRCHGLHEIDASEIFNAVKAVIGEISQFSPSAIAVTSFGETFTMLDENDRICAPSMLYTDPRGAQQCAMLIDKFGEENLSYKAGAAPHSMYSLPKIMWIKENMPQNYKQANKILLIQDYIIYMLSGQRCIDYSLAARTIAFDIKHKCWDKQLLDFCGIDEALLSTPVPSGHIAGAMKPELARELGLHGEILIVNGCHDQIAAITGSAVFDSETAMDGTGTVECVPIVMDEIPKNADLYKYGYSIAPHINGKYACYVLSYAGGATLKWFRDNFSDLSYSELDKLISDDPSELLILPHFAGAATPYMNSSSTAAILGLTFEHGKSDIYKALMEGTAFEIKQNFSVLENFGIVPKSLVASGGGANSDVWLQIKADVLGIPITALDAPEIGAAGTALLAGKALKLYNDNTRLARIRKSFYPSRDKHEKYTEKFCKYKKIYDAVKGI